MAAIGQSDISRSGGATLEIGASTSVRAGELESGDQWLMKEFPAGSLVAVIDGCGHGPEAASAARIARSVLEAQPGSGVIPLLARCHERLKGTRGVVMSLASFNAVENTLTWVGVGNVEGVLFRFEPAPEGARETLLLRAGVVGYSMPPLRASVVPIRAGDTLIFATDGIAPDFAASTPPEMAPRLLAGHLSRQYDKGTDDSLVVVARYLGTSE